MQPALTQSQARLLFNRSVRLGSAADARGPVTCPVVAAPTPTPRPSLRDQTEIKYRYLAHATPSRHVRDERLNLTSIHNTKRSCRKRQI